MKRLSTPWGMAQTVRDIGAGVLVVTCAGHGGVFVPRELLDRIPADEQGYAARWSGSPQWFEEDCAAAIVFFRLPELASGLTKEKIAEWYNMARKYWEGVAA